MTELLTIRDLRVSYGRVPTVHGADLTIAPGERVALVGASGSGKSTLAHAIIGLLPGSGRVTGGSIRWRGEDIATADERRLRALRGKEIGLVPQDPMSNLNPVARVGRQVSETLVAHRLYSGRAAKERAIELLGEAGLPEPARRARQYPHELSGGMRQRVLIAIGLSCRPGLLIADEPTSALDVTVQRQILDHLDTLTRDLDTALLLVTHDLGLAAERADRVLVMSDGRIVESGPAREVLTDPQQEYTRRLVAAAPVAIAPAIAEVLAVEIVSSDPAPREADTAQPEAHTLQPETDTAPAEASATGPEGDTAQPDTGTGTGTTQSDSAATQPDTGTTQPDTGTTQPDTGTTQPDTGTTQPEGDPTRPRANKPKPETRANQPEADVKPVLEVTHLSKQYRIRGGGGTLRAVDDVSFTIARGRTTAIVGESGSGKTTTARMILGLVPATSGTVRLDGSAVVGLRGAQLRAARRTMQPVFQDPYSSLDPMWSVRRLVAEPLRAFGVGDRAARAARVAELLEQVGLPAAVARRYPNELSGGQRQRVAIARALAVNPRLVVCDEAISALDVLVQKQILDLLADLQERLGVSYLFISHDLSVVRSLAHDVVVMRNGRVVEQGPADEILTAPADSYTQQLLDAIPGIHAVA